MKFSEIEFPPSPAGSSSSDISLQLDPSTLSLLDDFLASRDEEQQLFNQLSRDSADPGGDVKKSINVDEFKLTFSEDWQMSQFWYSTPFAMHIASILHANLNSGPERSTVAFLCSPTAFVSFTSHPSYDSSRCHPVLLEYDRRFAILPGRSVYYDLDDPQEVPEDLVGAVDMAILDPPFLNESTNTKLCQTLEKILRRPNGSTSANSAARVLLITAPSPCLSKDDIVDTYNSALARVHIQVQRDGLIPPPTMKETGIKVEHAGGRLKNDFNCWASWDVISVPKLG